MTGTTTWIVFCLRIGPVSKNQAKALRLNSCIAGIFLNDLILA